MPTRKRLLLLHDILDHGGQPLSLLPLWKDGSVEYPSPGPVSESLAS